MELRQFTDQALSLAYNYICTDRANKAIELISQVRKVDPDNQLTTALMDFVFAVQQNTAKPDLSKAFGVYWEGQSLEGMSIEIFCDQGMGDTLNLMRYLNEIKWRWNCKIVLNCYAFFDNMKDLMTKFDCVDEFVNSHIPCDYVTNIMSIPAILAGLKFDCYYPVHWKAILETLIPKQPKIYVEPAELIGHDGKSMKIGLAWETNAANELSEIKSIPLSNICDLETGKWELYQLTPIREHYNFVTQFNLSNLAQTAAYIQSMDVVISVDTCVLHLAGILGKRAYGILPYDADPRWGEESNTPWYPNMTLLRQGAGLDWQVPLRIVKNQLYKELPIE